MPLPIYDADRQSTTLAPVAAGTVSPDGNQFAQYLITMPAGNITIANPVNPGVGMVLGFFFTQDGTGGRTVTWGSAFKTAFQPVATANATSSVKFEYDGANWNHPSAVPVDSSGNLHLTGGVLNNGFSGLPATSAANAACSSVTVAAGSNDAWGIVTAISTAAIASNSRLCTITFNNTARYATAPAVIITNNSAGPSAASTYPLCIAAANVGATSFDVMWGNVNGPAQASTFSIAYMVLGRS